MRAKSLAARIAPLAGAAVLLLSLSVAHAAPSTAAGAKKPSSAAGTYVEGCSCGAPCACQLTGVEHGCQGVGAMTPTSRAVCAPAEGSDGLRHSGRRLAFAPWHLTVRQRLAPPSGTAGAAW
jgi:hypothetical protein